MLHSILAVLIPAIVGFAVVAITSHEKASAQDARRRSRF